MSIIARSPVENYFYAFRLDEADPSLAVEIKEALQIDVGLCLECGKCTGGCSVAHIFDFTPRKIVQMVRLGQRERLLHMDALWTCVSCQLCVDRCPSSIDVARIIDYVREIAYENGVEPTRKEVALFYELILDSLRKRGRLAETVTIIKFNYRSGYYLKDADIGLKMFFKGKLNPFSSKIRKISAIRRMFKMASPAGEGTR